MKWTLFLLLPLFFVACKSGEQPITRDEAMSFARRLEATVAQRQTGMLDSIFHLEPLVDKILSEAGRKSNKKDRMEVVKSIESLRLGKEIMGSLGADGTYQFLRYYEKDGRHHLVFRMYGDGGLNYHDMELAKRDDQVKVQDIYVFITGENFSRTLAKTLAAIFTATSDKSEEEVTRFTYNLNTMRKLVKEGDFAAARERFEKLPKNMKRERTFQLINLQITSELDTASYMQALQMFEDQYGNDPGAQLSMVDAYAVRKDFKKALNAVNVVDKGVGGDPLLHYYRAMLYKQDNQPEMMMSSLEQLQKEKPDFGDGVLELLAAYLERGETEKAAALYSSYKSGKVLTSSHLEILKLLHPGFAKAQGM